MVYGICEKRIYFLALYCIGRVGPLLGLYWTRDALGTGGDLFLLPSYLFGGHFQPLYSYSGKNGRFFLSTFVRLNGLEKGGYLILIPLVAAFASDSFALFAGMAFGKHKLAPELSPKKTVEGSVGGLVGAVALCIIYGVVLHVAFKQEVSYVRFALYGFL